MSLGENCDISARYETHSRPEVESRLRSWRYAPPRFSPGHLGGQPGGQAAQWLAAQVALPRWNQSLCNVCLDPLKWNVSIGHSIGPTGKLCSKNLSASFIRKLHCLVLNSMNE